MFPRTVRAAPSRALVLAVRPSESMIAEGTPGDKQAILTLAFVPGNPTK